MIYLDVYVQSVKYGKKIRIKALPGQHQLSEDYFVSCGRKVRGHYKVGTIFKTDVKLVKRKKGKSYLMIRFKQDALLPALEYYEHNCSL